jgi:hypothetical protein
MVSFLSMYGGGPDVIAAQERWAADAVAAAAPGSNSAYVNFVGAQESGGRDIAYPPATLARLRQVKRRYDPDNMFRLNTNISPA